MTEKNYWNVNVFSGYDPVFKKTALGNSARVHLIQQKDIFDSAKLISLSVSNPSFTHVFISRSTASSIYPIRWYNNGNEIKRCGHGTIAASYIVSECMFITDTSNQKNFSGHSLEPIVFKSFFDETIRSRVKDFSATDARIHGKTKQNQSAVKLCTLEFPFYNIGPHKNTLDKAILSKELQAHSLVQTPNQYGYVMAETKYAENIYQYSLNTTLLKECESRAIIYFAINNTNNGEYLVIFRYFAPQYGIDEDGATGSAASILAQYLFERNKIKTLKIFQASPKIGGLIYTNVNGDVITVSGQAELRERL